jgi:hypothetical protein
MRVRVVAVAALALVALACFPAGAGAKGRGDVPSSRQLIRIALEGTNGYSILVISNPRQHLRLETVKEDTATFSSEYLTRDTAPAPDRVQAKLLGLGSISVRFHPRGPVRHPATPGCDLKRPTVQPGVVRGTIKFVGEGDYTQVETREAEAEIEELKGGTCRYEPGPEPKHSYRRREEWTSKLLASGDGTYFLARKYQPGVLGESAQALYLAERGEAFETASGRVPLVIWKRATVTAPISTFGDAHPEHTVISPPTPFTGTGALARTSESVFTWTGDLSVQFPGLDPLSLAGPSFEPDYCLREAGCIHQQVREAHGEP